MTKVQLVFFEDGATGEWGLAHKETHDDTGWGEKFNSFWSGIGVSHDIWEHSHEFSHKYFKGDYAMNVGGEMAAMGAMWYYQAKLGLWDKRMLNKNSIYDPGTLMRKSTQDMVQEAIQYGNTPFGATLECNVPKQRPVDDDELEYQIEIFWKEVKKYNFKDDEDYKETSDIYKDSVTFRKIADLHRWGYRYAERLVPNNYANRNMMCDFIDFWNEFTKKNDAKELGNIFSGIDFTLKRKNGMISWVAVMNSKYPDEINNVILTEKSPTSLCIEDYYVNIEDEV